MQSGKHVVEHRAGLRHAGHGQPQLAVPIHGFERQERAALALGPHELPYVGGSLWPEPQLEAIAGARALDQRRGAQPPQPGATLCQGFSGQGAGDRQGDGL